MAEKNLSDKNLKKEVKDCIIKYYRCAEALFFDKKSQPIENFLRNIINKKDREDKTPLHYAVKYWPQSIVHHLLKWGADLSIKNENQKIPLKRVLKSTLLDVLNNHCMKSDGIISLDDDEQDPGSQDNENDENEKIYKKLLDEYEPRFMTNIGNSPVIFDYELLAPTPYIDPDQKDTEGGITTKAQPEMAVLSEISRSPKHRDVIKHPVIKSFIWMKWCRISRYYHRDLRAELLLLWFLTWYIFIQFGGLEWTHTCMFDKEPDPDHTAKLFKAATEVDSFCKVNRLKLDKRKLTDEHEYGQLQRLSFGQSVSHYLESFSRHFEVGGGEKVHHHATICLYAKPFYIMFAFMAGALLFWIFSDVKSMYNSPNPDERRHKQNNVFMSNVVPLGRDIGTLLIILAVLALSDGMLLIAISLISLSMLLREIIQFIVTPKTYFFKLSNWSDILLLVLIAVVVYVPNDLIPDPINFTLSSTIDNVCPADGNDQNVNNNCTKCCEDEKHPKEIGDQDVSVKRSLSAFLILLSWTRFIFHIARHPGKRTGQLNKYALMYKRVASSFLKLLFVYGLFIVAFALGFYIMFHNDVGDTKLDVPSLSSYVFFNTPWETLAKTVAMVVGEVDFNNMPIGISYARRDGNVSATLGYLYFLLFIFMSVVVLMNLLNGLAVSDISEIIEDAEVEHEISMIEILTEYEEMSERNREGLASFTKCVPGLKRFVVKAFDIGEELTLFPITNSPPDLESQTDLIPQNSKGLDRSGTLKNRRLPHEKKDSKEKDKSQKYNWMYKYVGKKQKIGYEDFVSDARVLLRDQAREQQMVKLKANSN